MSLCTLWCENRALFSRFARDTTHCGFEGQDLDRTGCFRYALTESVIIQLLLIKCTSFDVYVLSFSLDPLPVKDFIPFPCSD